MYTGEYAVGTVDIWLMDVFQQPLYVAIYGFVLFLACCALLLVIRECK
jgi:hypothetical protein